MPFGWGIRVAHGKELFDRREAQRSGRGLEPDDGNGDFFRHSSPAQVEEQGYEWRAWGENIAAGYATLEAVVNGWINSAATGPTC